MSQKIQ